MSENHCASNGCTTIQSLISQTLLQIRIAKLLPIINQTREFWNLTKPQMYPRSLLESFIVSDLPADIASSVSSFGLKPTRAIPFRTPIVAGKAPFLRTTDSRCKARAAFSGYGKPIHDVRCHQLFYHELSTMRVNSSFQSYDWLPRIHSILYLLRNLQKLVRLPRDLPLAKSAFSNQSMTSYRSANATSEHSRTICKSQIRSGRFRMLTNLPSKHRGALARCVNSLREKLRR